MKKLFIATGNENKLYEFDLIFKEFGLDIEIVSPKDFNDNSDPVEDGKTFEENAIIKAKYFYNKYHLPTIADDSGICVEFLNNFPGIYSARFMKTHSYEEKCEALITVLQDAPNRNASFNAVIAYIDENGDIHTFEGINKGTIAYKCAGNEGFGYDPIFVIPKYNKTEAELGLAYKNRYSHRALATQKFVQYLKENEK